MNRSPLLILAFTALFVSAFATKRATQVGFTYWDVGMCYDTIPSLFYDDSSYTPEGKYRWDSLRYWRKIRRVAAVVDSMRMPIVALHGVESEGVVRDIVSESHLSYSYLHRTKDGDDGLDFALLYFGDFFFVDYTLSDYGRLYIEGMVGEYRLGIWLTTSGYYINNVAPPEKREVDFEIIAGRLFSGQLTELGVEDLMTSHEQRGQGNATSKRGWYMRHRLGVKGYEYTPTISTSGVYITHWLLNDKRSAPKATISQEGYTDGYSRYLPIYTYLQMMLEL